MKSLREPTPYQITLQNWLPQLLDWFPYRQAVVIGEDTSRAVKWLPDATLMKKPIAEHSGAVKRYTASLIAESGLLPISDLKFAWPNIKEIRTEIVEAISLDVFIADFLDSQFNWFWITALPAICVLRGGKKALAGADVVLCRVALKDSATPELQLNVVKDFLESEGFLFLGVECEKNPALGLALFSRNFIEIANKLKITNENLCRETHHFGIRVDSLVNELDASQSSLREAQLSLKLERQTVVKAVRMIDDFLQSNYAAKILYNPACSSMTKFNGESMGREVLSAEKTQKETRSLFNLNEEFESKRIRSNNVIETFKDDLKEIECQIGFIERFLIGKPAS